MWEERMKMILNEYRLMPWQKEAQELVKKHMEDFFFGEGAALPPGRYTLRATIRPFGALAPFVRGFVVEPAVAYPVSTTGAAAARAPSSATGARSRASSAALARPHRFATSTVLDPGFVVPAIDRRWEGVGVGGHERRTNTERPTSYTQH